MQWSLHRSWIVARKKTDRNRPPSEELPGEAFKNRSSDWYEKRLASLSLFHDRLFGVKTGSVSGGNIQVDRHI